MNEPLEKLIVKSARENTIEQLLTELAVVLPQFANELPEDLGDNLMTWVDRIEEILKS